MHYSLVPDPSDEKWADDNAPVVEHPVNPSLERALTSGNEPTEPADPISTEDMARTLAKLMVDTANGKVDPNRARATCEVAKTMVKVVQLEMQAEWLFVEHDFCIDVAGRAKRRKPIPKRQKQLLPGIPRAD